MFNAKVGDEFPSSTPKAKLYGREVMLSEWPSHYGIIHFDF